MRTTWISALTVTMLCGWQAFAQTSAGVKGVVTDSSGALVPGATIVVTNLETGARRETATNESGVYQFPLLQPGRYTIAARKWIGTADSTLQVVLTQQAYAFGLAFVVVTALLRRSDR